MEIEELHDHLFDVLCTIDDICKEENIRYFLDSGTELGSVREHNFIPWDDDMDLKVMLEDYPKFKRAMEQKLPAHMHLIEPDAFAPAFYDYIVRIYDDRYLLRTVTEEDKYYNNYQNYVGTDIYIFSKIPNSKIIKKYILLMSKIYYGMGMAHRHHIDYRKYTLLHRMQAFVLVLVGRLFSVNWLWKHYMKLVSKWNSQETECYFAINYEITSKSGRIFDASHFSACADGIIRDRKFPIPIEYDKDLTQLYGDYMKPPKNRSQYRSHL